MTKCKICGTRLMEGTSKCLVCGATVTKSGEAISAPTVENIALAQYNCPSCGAKIGGGRCSRSFFQRATGRKKDYRKKPA